MVEEKNYVFDNQLFGLLIRRKRTNKGYKTAEDFARAIRDITGLNISKDTIYRIESGNQAITLEQAIAMNLVINERLFEGLEIEKCAPKSWNEIDKDTWYEEMDRMTGGDLSMHDALNNSYQF